ncbi:winged helix-turn-helix domain-containing protein [Rhizobiaceae bacterium n13]|uniref:ATP-binding protein n=1 Tax=Ferirhizobium litorale TaxID=2927786 RepID=UPI0024B2C50A|nr:winged helix-turn-helix domain-containing protein [Fererhizobium litorale]MDI7862848.1 winged helix-turn-helix domain-containing protein [Fererhizobium litorale]
MRSLDFCNVIVGILDRFAVELSCKEEWMGSAQTHDVVEFGPFRLHREHRRLFCGTEEVQIGGRAMEMLLALTRKKGELVTKEELFNAAWPGIFVHEANLKVTIASLRRSLREYSPIGNYVRTIVGRGYWLSDQLDNGEFPQRPDLPVAANTQFPELGTVIGRDAEIAELRAAIAVNRLTTIVGAGGIGKTTVAVAAAQLFEDEEGGSITFIDFSRVAGEEFVIPSLAAMLGISSGSQDRLDAISSILARRKALLLLDTCEHVVNAVAHLCDIILANTTDVRILATSRQALRAKGEEVVWLAPLEVPPAGRTLTGEEILRYSAPQLLVERASEKGAYTIRDGDAPAIAEICRRLDGSPLAIELISSRLTVLSAPDVLEELGDRFSALVERDREGPLRQQTLLATLEWSYALLTTSEATVLRAVSVFMGSFDMDAVVSVVAHHGLDPTVVFDAVAGLRAKSMLSVEQMAGGMRYRLLDSTRAFAGNLLETSAELTAVSQAYARLVLNILSRANADQARLTTRQWHAAYASYADDLRKAIGWALFLRGDPLLGIQLVASGIPLWHELSLSEEARRNSEQALAEFDRIGGADMALKLKLVVGMAAVSSYISADAGKAIETIESAIRLSRQIGDTNSECKALGSLARYHLLPGQQTAARKILRELKRVATRSKNRSALWEYEQLFTELEIIRCDYPAAISRMKKLRHELESTPDGTASRFDLDPKIRTETILGALEWLGSGRPGTGLSRIKFSANEAFEARHGWTLIYCYTHGVLFVLSECHEYELGRRYAEILKDTIYRHGMPAWIPVANCYAEALEALSGARSDADGLMSAFDELRTGLRQIGRHVYYALLIRALYALGHVDEGVRILDYLFDVGPQRSMVPELLRLRAVKERSVGRDEEAMSTLRQALQAAEENGAWAWRIRSATDLAILLRDKSQIDDAKGVLEPVYSQFKDGFETPDLQKARNLLTELQNFGRV